MGLRRPEAEQEPQSWVLSPAAPEGCSVLRAPSAAPPGQFPAWTAGHNPGVWTPEQEPGRMPALLGLERSRLFPRFGEI